MEGYKTVGELATEIDGKLEQEQRAYGGQKPATALAGYKRQQESGREV